MNPKKKHQLMHKLVCLKMMELENQSQPSCLGAVSGSFILPTELRVGNLVTAECYKGSTAIIKVESIDKNGVNLEIGRHGHCPDYESIWIQPYYRFKEIRAIPISEDLLLKLGAVKLDFKDFPSFNLFGMQINFVNGLWVESVSRVEVTALHHLQNIFFFRNSEELQVGSLTLPLTSDGFAFGQDFNH